MARSVTLGLRTSFLGAAVIFGLGANSLRAETPTMQPAADATVPAAPGKTPAAKTPASKTPAPAPGNTAPVPSFQDVLNKYGRIIEPGTEPAHPLRLKLPFPGVGEVKLPTGDELKQREKLEQLANLSDEEIHTQLEQWPAYTKMNLRDQGSMLGRIQDFRDYRTKVAQQKARDMGLSTLTAEQKAKFEKDYWAKRLQMDRDLVKQFTPIFQAREQKLKDDLFREFSSTSSVPVVQSPKSSTTTAPDKTVEPMLFPAETNRPSNTAEPVKSAVNVGLPATEPMQMQQ